MCICGLIILPRFPAQLCYAFRRWNDIGMRILPVSTPVKLRIHFRHRQGYIPQRNAGKASIPSTHECTGGDAARNRGEFTGHSTGAMPSSRNEPPRAYHVVQDVLHGVTELRTAATDVHSDSHQLILGMSDALEQVRYITPASQWLSVMCCLAEHARPSRCYQRPSHTR